MVEKIESGRFHISKSNTLAQAKFWQLSTRSKKQGDDGQMFKKHERTTKSFKSGVYEGFVETRNVLRLGFAYFHGATRMKAEIHERCFVRWTGLEFQEYRDR